MLVLTRRDGETIMIGDDVEITIVECHRDAVRIGIEAPLSTKIRRGELLEGGKKRSPKKFKEARRAERIARARDKYQAHDNYQPNENKQQGASSQEAL